MNDLAKYLFLLLVFVLVCLAGQTAFAADPGDDTVDCDVTVTVNQIIEWESDNDMTTIALVQIDIQGHDPEGSSTYTLWMNCNVALNAENTIAAQLDNVDDGGSDTLITTYKITYDADGSAATGGTNTTYEDYSTFIDGAGSAITHYDNDGAVEVTLWAQAVNDSTGHGEVSDAGDYEATQTLTASWTGD